MLRNCGDDGFYADDAGHEIKLSNRLEEAFEIFPINEAPFRVSESIEFFDISLAYRLKTFARIDLYVEGVVKRTTEYQIELSSITKLQVDLRINSKSYYYRDVSWDGETPTDLALISGLLSRVEGYWYLRSLQKIFNPA